MSQNPIPTTESVIKNSSDKARKRGNARRMPYTVSVSERSRAQYEGVFDRALVGINNNAKELLAVTSCERRTFRFELSELTNHSHNIHNKYAIAYLLCMLRLRFYEVIKGSSFSVFGGGRKEQSGELRHWRGESRHGARGRFFCRPKSPAACVVCLSRPQRPGCFVHAL